MAINLTDFYMHAVEELDWATNSSTDVLIVPTACRLKSIHIGLFSALDSAVTVTSFRRPAGGAFVSFQFVIPVMPLGYYELDCDTVLGAELQMEAGDQFFMQRSSAATTCNGTFTAQFRQDRSR
jgi:hypothetical protein